MAGEGSWNRNISEVIKFDKTHNKHAIPHYTHYRALLVSMVGLKSLNTK